MVHPEPLISHVRAFLFNMDPTVAPYFPQSVIRAEQLLGLRTKASSITCERAYSAINLHKRHMFWHRDYAHCQANVSTRDMIDMDQVGMKIEASNPHFGKAVSWERCHLDGSYNSGKK